MNLLLSVIILMKLAFIFVHCAPRDPYRTCSCGELGHFVKIVGGREARPHSYPWTAALVGFPEEDKFFCGATIISSRFLITAGHCLYEASKDWSYDRVRVKLGIHNLTDKDVLVLKPKAFKRYEGYTEENEINAPLLDIALIELDEDLPVNDKIRPICIHSKYFNYHINELKAKRPKLRAKRDVSFAQTINDFFNKLMHSNDDSNAKTREGDVLDGDTVDEATRFTKPPGPKPQPKPHPAVDKNKSEDVFVDQPTDKTKIILNHPDKNLISQVVKTVDDYYAQIRNDPKKVFDPAKEFSKDKLTVVGWGSTDRYDLSILPDVLMETQISQKKPEKCENAYGDDVFFRSKMICANDEDTDSCNGDSGGPLKTKSYGRMNLYGLVSYGRACGSFSSPGVYTRISAFLEWILLHTVDSKFCPN